MIKCCKISKVRPVRFTIVRANYKRAYGEGSMKRINLRGFQNLVGVR